MARVNWTDRSLSALDGIHTYLTREAPFYWVVTDERIDILSVIHGSRDLTRTDNFPWETN